MVGSACARVMFSGIVIACGRCCFLCLNTNIQQVVLMLQIVLLNLRDQLRGSVVYVQVQILDCSQARTYLLGACVDVAARALL